MSGLLDNPGLVWSRLADIEQDLETRQNEYEQAAEDAVRVKRDYELRKAKVLVVAAGNNKEEREANAVIALAAAEDNIWQRFTDAEAKLAGMKAAINVLSTRASIGQSVLKSQERHSTTSERRVMAA